MEYNKSAVRRSFKYARELMQDADKMMKDKTITDFTNDSDFGQLANELIANVTVLQCWLDEMIESQKVWRAVKTNKGDTK